jgi:hypothetical protein
MCTLTYEHKCTHNGYAHKGAFHAYENECGYKCVFKESLNQNKKGNMIA